MIKIKTRRNKKSNIALSPQEQELYNKKMIAIEYIASQTHSSFANMQACFNDLRKEVIEACLVGEINAQIKDDKEQSIYNKRNGYSSKEIMAGSDSKIKIDIPRDREGNYIPLLVEKHCKKLDNIDEVILKLYQKGTSVHDITDLIYSLYGYKISESMISEVTNSISDKVEEFRNRMLDAIYTVAYFDGIVLKVSKNKEIINMVFYIIVGVNLNGKKEILGIYNSENEGAKFWLYVLTDLNNRGVKDILIACIDGLKGFPEAISSVFPKTDIQLCIVHLLRNSLKYVSYKDRKEICAAFKMVYTATNHNTALMYLDQIDEQYKTKYPYITKCWRNNWDNVIKFLEFPDYIRKAIYTTNAIESINSSIRRKIPNTKIFPNEDSAYKMIYLILDDIQKRWSMPITNWSAAINCFMIKYEGRIPL